MKCDAGFMDCSPKCWKYSMLIGKSSWLHLYSRAQVFSSTNPMTLQLLIGFGLRKRRDSLIYSINREDSCFRSHKHCDIYVWSLFVQVDVDIGSSTVANGVLGLVIGVITTLVVDMAFLIQVCFQTLQRFLSCWWRSNVVSFAW